MSETPIQQLAAFGQSVWYDNLSRRLLQDGELSRLIGLGVVGVTANPTIYQHALAEGQGVYDAEVGRLARLGRSAGEIYDQLIVEDVRSACDELRSVYDATGGRDGYVSLEVAPALAHDTDGTVGAAARYWGAVARPNLMIKIPATPEGVPAISATLARGINVNVTLIFAARRYQAVMEAFCAGLEARLDAGQPVEGIHSVASFFVSRVDTEVDRRLTALAEAPGADRAGLEALMGRAAIANAKLAYQEFERVFRGGRFARLRAAGVAVQRPLWASTSTKNPRYRDVVYCEELIGPDTVNTMPPISIEHFMDHGRPRASLQEDPAGAGRTVAELARAGVDLDEVTALLETQGVASFAASMEQLLQEIEAQRQAAVAGPLTPAPRARVGAVPTPTRARLQGRVATAVGDAAARLGELDAEARLRRRDPSLWTADRDRQAAIAERLGWLGEPAARREGIEELRRFATFVRDQGFSAAVLVGMGGSSLCPDVLRRTFGVQPGYPDLTVLDSTDPDQVARVLAAVDPAHTLLIVSSKSGTTTETLSHCRCFMARWRSVLGADAGGHAVAVTDPGTPLEALARELGFATVFRATPTIGGRYSALSHFGLVPAAAMGIAIDHLLASAQAMVEACHMSEVPGPVGAAAGGGHPPGSVLAAILGGCAAVGRNKVTLVADPGVGAIGTWIEQLLAESTGKEGRGLVPVTDEPVGAPEVYGADRVFVHVRLESDPEDAGLAQRLEALTGAGHPVVTVTMGNPLDLGAEFVRWEVATALAGALLGIDPFDQPNVQESKDNTGRLLDEFAATGRLPEPAPELEVDGLALTGAGGATSLEEALAGWLHQVAPPTYLACMAYAPMGEPELAAALARLRVALRARSRCATTVGYGPRFLHSTGQLHKGGPAGAAFLQITTDHAATVAIPGAPYDFGTLQAAQALGDYQALVQRGRRVVRVHCHEAAVGVDRLAAALEASAAAVPG